MLVSLSASYAQILAVPNSLNFQGRLAKPDGTPVADGTYSIRFRLFDALTGGNVKFTQTVSGIAVKHGVFMATLTGFTAGTFDGALYLEIKIGHDPVLTPRQPLVTTTSSTLAHAIRATDRVRIAEAVLGKAMSSLKRGKDLVLVQVTLQ